jgi:hypothetical protein
MRPLLVLLVLGGCETFFPLEFDAGVTDVIGPPDQGSQTCPDSFDLPPGATTYRVLDASMTWSQAEDECENGAPSDAHLVVPNSGVELTAVQFVIKQRMLGQVWVGVGRKKSAVKPIVKASFQTVNGEELTDLWLNGEPNDTSTREFGVVIDGSSGFQDVSFDEIHPAICECDHLKPDATLDEDWN